MPLPLWFVLAVLGANEEEVDDGGDPADGARAYDQEGDAGSPGKSQ